jgi:hypothetical protein
MTHITEEASVFQGLNLHVAISSTALNCRMDNNDSRRLLGGSVHVSICHASFNGQELRTEYDKIASSTSTNLDDLELRLHGLPTVTYRILIWRRPN